MTEQEAIKQLQFDMDMITFNPNTGEDISLEVLKLRNEENYKTYLADDVAINALEEIQKYRAIGTVEECRIAVEKQKIMKPHKNFEKFSGVWCSCGKYLGKGYFVDKPNYCSDCGQKLDWSDEE